MKKLLCITTLSLCATTLAYANVQLVNITPQNGAIGIKYQMLCQQEGKVAVCGLPVVQQLTPQAPVAQVAIPADKAGLRVIAMQYQLIKTPDHWYTLPTDQCQVVNTSGKVNTSATQHSINCQTF